MTVAKPIPPAPEELALIIIRRDGFASSEPGSILANNGRAWRYQDDGLSEVPWSEYERATGSDDQKDWPPYTITFAVSPLSADNTLTMEVYALYDAGIIEGSRGGADTIWTLKYQDETWQVMDIEYSMFDD
ncbi:hypothetical protein [Geobacter sp. DSM 9736]|uniref:hypothetical protein n=1 Tax=Geobacter sp. DSM 9736 TaxID=1277350 RepID=UPI000B5141AE|nr:hypothetical protein [Geobacter sp. DSM 9736]SNB44622.1 hypothetical protein SAMN06269301_0009 [Geobacter sp. DSM 9736]